VAVHDKIIEIRDTGYCILREHFAPQLQGAHVDYQRPLFSEAPDLLLPAYALVVSFGLTWITPESGAIEIAPGTHRMPREEALQAVKSGQIGMQPVSLEIGDVLIRHPWALHRGSPNTTAIPRALVSIRYVRPWYAEPVARFTPLRVLFGTR
jgi:ectoine hydroxylase-related dioxygenase (phytanoyl-CoA dioxygenase family)